MLFECLMLLLEPENGLQRYTVTPKAVILYITVSELTETP